MNQNIQIREERLQHLLDRHEALTTRPNDVEIPISNAPSSPLTPSPDATAKRNFLSVSNGSRFWLDLNYEFKF